MQRAYRALNPPDRPLASSRPIAYLTSESRVELLATCVEMIHGMENRPTVQTLSLLLLKVSQNSNRNHYHYD